MTIPVYNPLEPPRLQENDWDCSVESIEWNLYAWGRTPDDNWIENSMIAAGVVDPAVGCTDASGAGLANWVNVEYGEFGYLATNANPVSFDQVAEEANIRAHPLAMGGRAFYHWVGVRGYDPQQDLILLANPAPGWKNCYQTMSRVQFDQLGSFSLVRVTHPEAEGLVPPSAPTDPLPPVVDLNPWVGRVGSGILDQMYAAQVFPLQEYSTWLPLGRMPAQVEECLASDGSIFRWSLIQSKCYRYFPA